MTTTPETAAISLVVALDPTQLRRAQMRRSVSAVAVLGACIVWFLMLGRMNATTDGLPWYITSGLIAIVCAVIVVRSPAVQFEFTKIRSREPLSLLETWAIAYLISAVALYSWVLFHAFLPPDKAAKVVNIVDIQLVSEKDFANRESPMPGTEEQSQLHKRQSDRITVQGDFTVNKAASMAPKPKPTLVAQKQVIAPPLQPTPYVVPTLPQPVVQAHQAKPSQQFVMEEVQPPELVEMLENDGVSDATHVFESGGSSADGKGAQNQLSVYIKELHRRIKQAWSPPRGQSRQAKLLFRIRRDGRLAFVKLTSSSGHPETDEAALKAITTAVRTRLPDEYKLPFLDVQYTFNYTADELKEVKVQISPSQSSDQNVENLDY